MHARLRGPRSLQQHAQLAAFWGSGGDERRGGASAGSATAAAEEAGAEEGIKLPPARPRHPQYLGLAYVPACDAPETAPEAIFPPAAAERPPPWAMLPKALASP